MERKKSAELIRPRFRHPHLKYVRLDCFPRDELGRTVKRCWIHSIRSTCGSWTRYPGAEWHHTQGLIWTNHRQVCQQPEQQQQGDTTDCSIPGAPGESSIWRPHSPSNRPLQVHSTVATIQVPTRLYSLYPRKKKQLLVIIIQMRIIMQCGDVNSRFFDFN